MNTVGDADDAQIFEAIVYFLSHPNGMRVEKDKINYDTEIYHELGIYGFDFIALLVFLWDEFGMEIDMDKTRECVPGDVDEIESYKNILNYIFGLKLRRKKYKSATVRSLIEAVNQKRWPPSPV